MRQCIELIQTNQSFSKSVNLQLDLGNCERIGNYIPTRSSIAILERYFASVSGALSENATILIGPYGKGKSHLLLVLLALLQGKNQENELLLHKIEKNAGSDASRHIRMTVETDKKYLPVLVNPVMGNDLSGTFLSALREALLREGFAHIAPDSYYSQAIDTMESWRVSYPDTYHKFEQLLRQRGVTCEKFRKAMEHQEKEQLSYFIEIYPVLTSGSTFAPMLQIGVLKAYQQIGRILKEEYGYAGIYIVFDEFSKYIEGHAEEGFSNDMRTLQDMCELANNSKQELFLTLVAHKSIREYARGISLTAKNAFRGVEGRLTEVEFVVSAQNNYELIADAIIKREPQFSMEYRKLEQQETYRGLIEESRRLPCFLNLFTEEEFMATIAKGCFPMAPLFCYALLHLSERIAQNERTIFTFLAGAQQGSLGWLIQKGQDCLIGVDKIYDYFQGLFRETLEQPLIHNEWVKAKSALLGVEDETERAVIKAIAIIRMIHREEEFPAKNDTIRLSLAIEEQKCKRAIEQLKEQEIIVYRSSIGVYAFRNNVGVDVEKEILKKAAQYKGKQILCRVLQNVLEVEYSIPKQYNQKYVITRYFQYVYMEEQDFLRLTSAEYLFEESFSDGKIIVLIAQDFPEQEMLQKHLEELRDERVLLLLSKKRFCIGDLAEKYQAVEDLMQDGAFLDGNQLLLQELSLYQEDIAFEINAWMEDAYLPENQNVYIMQAGKQPIPGTSAAAFSCILSDICENYYRFSPKVNHELLNIRNVGVQYLRARNAVIKKLLGGEDCSGYCEGTSPEAMVYRAAFLHTEGDTGCQRVFQEIDQFFQKCSGTRTVFHELYVRLLGKDYGVRKGIIPLFLAKKLSDIETAAVIYVGKREMEIDYETLNKVNEHPKNYELYLEQETAEKEQYLQDLERLFYAEHSNTGSKQGRTAGIIHGMQNWYRSLPQYAMITVDFETDDLEKVKVLRNSLKRAEINPRELIFDRFLQAFGAESYSVLSGDIKKCKELLEQKLEQLKEDVAFEIKKIFGAHQDSGLKACLADWYQEQISSSRNYVLSTIAGNFMNYISTLQTNHEGDIVARISKIILDIYIEDWKDDTRAIFLEELFKVKEEIEHIRAREEQTDSRRRIILKSASGEEIEKYYDADTGDTTSMYLKNVMAEALEEFGDTLEKNQKVAVLVEMLEELLQ